MNWTVAGRIRSRLLTGLAVGGLVVAFAGGVPPGLPSARAAPHRPNILFILTDDQRWDTLWAMPEVRHRLVDRGIEFTNAFVVNSLCCPSRASILTGEYSHSTGVYTNGRPYGGFPAFNDRSTVATWLHAAGYRTALIGKYLNLYGGTYVPPGWDRWVAFEMDSALGSYYYNYALNVDGSIRSYGQDSADYSTDVLTEKAVRFVRHTRDPFFLYFAPWAPHGPAVPSPIDQNSFENLKPARPPNFNEKDVSDKPRWVRRRPILDAQQIRALDRYRRAQLQALLDVDRSIGRLLNALRDTGRLRDTVVVFMSDNGLAWGEHRWTNKQAAYEESIRIPFIIRYDPLMGQPRRVAQLALNIDIAPTFAALAKVSAPGSEGRSLLPILRDEATTWRRRFLIEHRTLGGSSPTTFCAERSRRYLYVTYRSLERELYDLRTDPYELRNRAHDPTLAWVRRRLRTQLHALCNPPPPGMERPPASRERHGVTASGPDDGAPARSAAAPPP